MKFIFFVLLSNLALSYYRKNKVIRVNLPSLKPKKKNYNPKKVDWSSVISGCKAAYVTFL